MRTDVTPETWKVHYKDPFKNAETALASMTVRYFNNFHGKTSAPAKKKLGQFWNGGSIISSPPQRYTNN